MPRKTWTAYEKVTASDLNTNLSDQSVMTFATTTDRDAALPTPTVGMQSAVQASPDIGQPRYWDGSAWQLVKSGFTSPNVLTLPSVATDYATGSVTQTWATNTWYQVTASMPTDSVVVGVSRTSSNTFTGAPAFELGVGASGSEVVRGVFRHTNNSGVWMPLPYGVFVGAGQRLAIRVTNSTSGASTRLAVHWVTNSTVDDARSGRTAALSAGTTTAWVEVDTTPPLAGGCWVLGFTGSTENAANNAWELGLGAAGSEVVASGQAYGNEATNCDSYIAPFFWPASTRLAIRTTVVRSSTNVNVIWRESLT